MAIPYADWLSRAEKLPLGRSSRVSHDCGEGAPMLIEHTREGFRCWCHRCGDGGFKSHGRQALAEYIQRWNEEAELHEARQTYPELPDDCSASDMPWNAVRWLGRANVTASLIQRYGIGYSRRTGRVYLPVYMLTRAGRGVRLAYYQARAVHPGQTPKYLNPKANKAYLWFNSRFIKPEHSAVEARSDPQRVAVVTEDILSAIRAGQVRLCDGCSILGTSPSTWHITQLMQYRHVIIWLDPDAAGDKGAAKLRKSLDLMGARHSTLKSERDPKLYTHRELQEMIECHLTSLVSG